MCLASVQTSVWPRRPFAVVAAAVQAPAPAVPSVDSMVKKVAAIWFRKVIQTCSLCALLWCY